MQSDILWSPGAEALADSALGRFASDCGFDAGDYASLHAWSVSDLGAFWRKVWDFCGVVGEPGDIAFVPDDAAWMTGARFFPDARLNVAENMLHGDDNAVVAYSATEDGQIATTVRGALRAKVARVAEGLKQAGVESGDRVAGVLPNTVDALVAVMATAAIGAVWTSCSPDFGAAAIVDRIGQVTPKVLFSSSAYVYNGRHHDISARLGEVLARVPSVRTLVLSGSAPCRPETTATIFRQADFGSDAPLSFARMPFDHPVYILYTSGTTGAPKAIVHRTGGVILQHAKEHRLHGDVRPGDTLLWYTNTAWMMYHWMISALGCGAAVVLYDGAPMIRTGVGSDCAPLWRVSERTGTTHLGISPKYLATLAAEGYRPGERHDLDSLRVLMSAGAPVLPRQFDWVYEAIKQDMMFASISGGTEILGCFLIGSPIHPARRGQLTVPALGHAIAVLDDRGAAVIGRQGELVCTEPFPSMPLSFWGPDGDERYRAAYFSARREIWTHGDIAELTPTGGGIVHGRSDSTLKPGGVRIGTADIYAACETLAEIEDCIAFGLPYDGDEEVVLCVKPAAAAAADSALAARIRARIRAEASPRHVPANIHFVQEIPYTINGKRVESAARAAAAGGRVANQASLANPACLDEYRALRRDRAL